MIERNNRQWDTMITASVTPYVPARSVITSRHRFMYMNSTPDLQRVSIYYIYKNRFKGSNAWNDEVKLWLLCLIFTSYSELNKIDTPRYEIKYWKKYYPAFPLSSGSVVSCSMLDIDMNDPEDIVNKLEYLGYDVDVIDKLNNEITRDHNQPEGFVISRSILMLPMIIEFTYPDISVFRNNPPPSNPLQFYREVIERSLAITHRNIIYRFCVCIRDFLLANTDFGTDGSLNYLVAVIESIAFTSNESHSIYDLIVDIVVEIYTIFDSRRPEETYFEEEEEEEGSRNIDDKSL